MNEATCPYCNATVAEGTEECPVCGERIAKGPASSPAPVTQTRDAKPNKWLVPGVVGVLLLAGGVIAGLAFWPTENEPRPDGPEPPAVVEIETPEPAKWPGLEHLPAGCNLVVAWRPGADAGFGLDFGQSSRAVERTTGVSVKSLVAVALGMRVVKEAIPPWAAILTASEPFDLARLREKGKPVGQGDREMIRVSGEGLPIDFLIHSPEPKTLVVAESADLLEPADEARPKELGDLIKEKVPGRPSLWAVANTSGWEESLAGRFLTARAAPNVPAEQLARLDRFTLAFEPRGQGEKPLTSVWLKLDDEAGELRGFLNGRLGGEEGVTIGGNGPEAFARVAGDFDELKRLLKRVSQEP